MNIGDLRRDYTLESLNETSVQPNPYQQFTHWWEEVLKAHIVEPNAMTLATAGNNGRPHARIVLLKDYNESGFVFYTNYSSHKGKEIDENPFASLVFFWKELERQVRIEGRVEKTDTQTSEAYFNSRPEGSKIGAWASPQSETIASRTVLEERWKAFHHEFSGKPIQRPEHWGGYRLVPDRFEFWQGRSSRLHDRIVYTKQDHDTWKIERLAP